MKLRLLAASLILTVSAPAMATTIVSNSVATGTNATVDALSDPESDSDDLGGATGIASATSTSSVQSGGSSAQASNTISAAWLSADAGTVDITWGWLVDSLTNYVVETNTSTNWTYSFIASGNGTFDISGDVTASGSSPFGLWPINIGGDGSGEIGGDFNDPTGSDAFSFALVSGQQYTFTLANNGNLSAASGTTSANGHAIIQWFVNYSTAPVPEPASWMLMIGGLGLTGATLRRRSATVKVQFS